MIVNIYFTNILQGKPSKPQGLIVTADDVEPNISFHPKLNWQSNLEPDVILNGGYKIYKVTTSDPNNQNLLFQLIATVPSSVNGYVDSTLVYYDKIIIEEGCVGFYKYYIYKIVAFDNTYLESLPSDRNFIAGYTQLCKPINDNNYSINSNNVHTEYTLDNYPNPFNSITSISYSIPNDNKVVIKIYDLLGREIETLVNEFKHSGNYRVYFNAGNLSSGIYFYSFQSDDYRTIKKMVLIK